MERLDKAMDKVGFGWSLVIALLIQAAAGLILLSMTGCMILAGTPAGIREYGEMTNGTIAEARTPEGQKGSFWQLRELKEVERTKRETSPGWWSKLMAGK